MDHPGRHSDPATEAVVAGTGGPGRAFGSGISDAGYRAGVSPFRSLNAGINLDPLGGRAHRP